MDTPISRGSSWMRLPFCWSSHARAPMLFLHCALCSDMWTSLFSCVDVSLTPTLCCCVSPHSSLHYKASSNKVFALILFTATLHFVITFFTVCSMESQNLHQPMKLTTVLTSMNVVWTPNSEFNISGQQGQRKVGHYNNEEGVKDVGPWIVT